MDGTTILRVYIDKEGLMCYELMIKGMGISRLKLIGYLDYIKYHLLCEMPPPEELADDETDRIRKLLD